MSNGPSEHLSWSELGCPDGTPYPTFWRNDRAIKLASAFEMVRTLCGDKPIKVTSGFRTARYNATLPGAAGASQHIAGRALDLVPPEGMTVHDFQVIALRATALPDSVIRGLGLYKDGHVHIDVRDSATLVLWRG